MKQETNDIVLKVLTEWNQYEVRMNFDTTGDELIRNFVNIMRSMTFPSIGIVGALRDVADEIEEEMKSYNNEENDDLDYGATD